MQKYFKTSVFLLLAAVFLSVACKPNDKRQQSIDTVTYTVTFVVEGGKDAAPAPESVVKDGKVEKPTPPISLETGKAFRHWATEKGGESAYNFSMPVTANLTLYAVWGIKVVLKLKNDDELIVAAAEGKSLSIPPNAKKKHALFRYWSETENGADVYDFTKPVIKPFTLHAFYYEIPAGQKRIYDIQGSGHTSTEKGQNMATVPGIVTAIHYSKKKADGSYMQDQDGDENKVTSDGIYVYCGADQFPMELKAGDAVTVNGAVVEHAFDSTQLAITQIKITAQADVTVLSSGNPLPAAVEIETDKLEKPVFIENLNNLSPASEAIDYYESLEGMRVKMSAPKIIAAPYKNTQYIASEGANGFTPRGGLMYNSYNSTGRVCLYPYACFAEKEEAGVANPEPTIGDSYNGDIIGVLGYSYGNYQIEITEKLPELTRGNIAPESSAITFDTAKLNIVSYNLENFSFESKMQQYNSSTNKWGKATLHSSGKTSEERAAAFAEHFITQMKAPDVICLIEIQDDNSGSPDTTVVTAETTLKLLTDKIAAISGAPTYKAVNIDPQASADPTSSVDGGAPGANIRCCYLYRDDRIELVSDSDGDLTNSKFDTKAEIEADGSKLTQNPARIGVGDSSFDACRKSLVAHFKFKDTINDGKDFFVINNHLTSKRGDGKIWGATQPVVRASEANRRKQAEAITVFINSVKGKRPDARIISVGDYNDFWFSETIGKVKAAGMKNAIEVLSENERYTYVYDGHSQTLDNILVTDNMTIDYADVLHLNSEFSPKVRLSDHDPVFVKLSW